MCINGYIFKTRPHYIIEKALILHMLDIEHVDKYPSHANRHYIICENKLKYVKGIKYLKDYKKHTYTKDDINYYCDLCKGYKYIESDYFTKIIIDTYFKKKYILNSLRSKIKSLILLNDKYLPKNISFNMCSVTMNNE